MATRGPGGEGLPPRENRVEIVSRPSQDMLYVATFICEEYTLFMVGGRGAGGRVPRGKKEKSYSPGDKGGNHISRQKRGLY